LTKRSKDEKRHHMINFPLCDRDMGNYEFDPHKLRELRSDLYSDYQQLAKLCRTLPFRSRSEFTSSQCSDHVLPLTRSIAMLLNQVAVAVRARDSIVARLNLVIRHERNISLSHLYIESLAHALLHVLDRANMILAHVESISPSEAPMSFTYRPARVR
jgi:hypothetical protein